MGNDSLRRSRFCRNDKTRISVSAQLVCKCFVKNSLFIFHFRLHGGTVRMEIRLLYNHVFSKRVRVKDY